jgi:molybdate transport system substrate-binding protein
MNITVARGVYEMLTRRNFAALSLAVTLAAPAQAASKPILVFAAASLKEGLDAVVEKWTTIHPDAPVTVNYAASSALAKLIAEGAPADVFFSADEAWMDDLETRALIRIETRLNVLSNSIVLIANAKDETFSSGLTLDVALAARGKGKLALANTKAVPAGKYAKAALEKLGFWTGVKDDVVEGENVRAALAFVARGEAVLGVVYTSDAFVESKVKVVYGFPPDSHAPIVYPAALISSSQTTAAGDFLDFIASDESKVIFATFGFETTVP